MNLFRNFAFTLLILLPALLISDSSRLYVNAAESEDAVEGEDIDVNVETNSEIVDSEDETLSGLKASPDVDVTVLFTKPSGNGFELPVGKEVHFLVGFLNKGSRDFFVDTMDASFRYSQDFNFYLQNFTTFAYNRVVKPKQEVTLSYQFYVSDVYTPRPYGLSVNLYYRDADNKQYLSPVFNETINIVELDEGLDTETFFLFIILAALVVLGLVGAYQLLQSFGKKHISSTSSKPKVEVGTSNHEDVDYDWLPQSTIKQLNKSPNQSKPNSPRQRRAKKE
ncbi:hypothetical protein RDWZM_007240 [Blomia tropicalis]|uniref:Translocon-associated protein subunit alpha n=1 Tax=Blomia tropicalis TaxID=40697 RepID=A0A9Q0M9Z0_BLOTA|nr:hypothetical protein RDWZM_007240 [Blomia tropicalis]